MNVAEFLVKVQLEKERERGRESGWLARVVGDAVLRIPRERLYYVSSVDSLRNLLQEHPHRTTNATVKRDLQKHEIRYAKVKSSRTCRERAASRDNS